jgi:general secretion pathway protein G
MPTCQPATTRRRAHRAAGFTLVEIMVVIVILGLLATIVGSSVLGRSERAELKTAEMNIGEIMDVVEMYMVENRHRIPTWEDLLTPDAKGHRYIEREDPPEDPWGNQYQITADPEFESKPMVLSWGPDRIENTEDDITSKSITQSKER